MTEPNGAARLPVAGEAAAGGGRDRRRTVRLLGRLIRRHWTVLTASLSANLLAAGFEGGSMGLVAVALQVLATPPDAAAAAPAGQLGELVARFLPDAGRDRVFLTLIGLALVSQLVRSALEFGGRAAAIELLTRTERDVRASIITQLMTMPFGAVRKYQTGDLTSLGDQVNYLGFVIQRTNLTLSQALLLVAYLLLLFWLSWPLTLIALAGLALISVALVRIMRKARRIGRDFTQASVAFSARTVDFLQGLRQIRTYAREPYAISKVEEVIADGMVAKRRGLLWQATITPLIDTLTVAAVVVLLGAGYLLHGMETPGLLPKLLAYMVILSRLLPRLKSINDNLGLMNHYWPFLERIAGILDLRAEEGSRGPGRPFTGLERAVDFERVSLRYTPDGEWAVRDLSASIPRGSFVALVGRSGSGKSTFADLLLGLYRPTEGAVRVDGTDLGELDWDAWRRRMGVVSQDTFLFHDTVRNNIAFGRLEATDDEIVEAARAAHAHDFITQLPAGYDTVVGDRGQSLSGGQRQRLAIAVALLRDPEILILDEATSELDSESEREIQAAIGSFRGERTVLAIAHRLSTVTAADRILVLDRGRIVEQGTHAELLARGGDYRRLWETQNDRDRQG